MKVCELGGGSCPRYCRKFGNGINVDVRKIDDWVDVVANFDKPLPLESHAFDFVYSQYTIEHVNWRRLEQFISEIYRITAPGGKIMIYSPNLREQCKIIANKTEITFRDLQMLFGDLDYSDNSHKSSMSPEMAERLFAGAGFTDIVTYPHPYTPTDFILEAKKP